MELFELVASRNKPFEQEPGTACTAAMPIPEREAAEACPAKLIMPSQRHLPDGHFHRAE
jgi:hypothetical protein